MSAVSMLQVNHKNMGAIEPGSLLEDLYTNYSLQQLQDMLETEPDQSMLSEWTVTKEEFRVNLNNAIEFVEND